MTPGSMVNLSSSRMIELLHAVCALGQHALPIGGALAIELLGLPFENLLVFYL